MPRPMQISHAGKKDPRILKVGALPQPMRALRLPETATDSIVFRERCTTLRSFPVSESLLWPWLRWLYLNQIAGLEREISSLQQQLGTRKNVFRSRLRKCLLRRDHIDQVPHSIPVSLSPR